MTVRHRQRKGTKSGFFLYAREKAFSKPPTFPPKPPEDSLHRGKQPYTPRQFSPQHSPVARPFRGKKGLFCPQRPPYPPPKGARTPRFAPAPPVFCPARARMKHRVAPVLPGTPEPAHTPGTPVAPACAAFLPARARSRTPCAARTSEGCPARRAPPARPLPPPAARRSARQPRQGTALGLATPTAVVGFSASPWRSVRPQGGIRSLGMTGKRPPPPLA